MGRRRLERRHSSSSQAHFVLSGSIPLRHEPKTAWEDPLRIGRSPSRLDQAHSGGPEGPIGLIRRILERQKQRPAWRAPFRLDQGDSRPSDASDGLSRSILEHHRMIPSRQKPGHPGMGLCKAPALHSKPAEAWAGRRGAKSSRYLGCGAGAPFRVIRSSIIRCSLPESSMKKCRCRRTRSPSSRCARATDFRPGRSGSSAVA